MKEYITLDAHKHYSFAAREDAVSGKKHHQRIEHQRGSIRRYLEDIEPGTTVAVEATGNWYWIVEEIEAAGGKPALVHPRKAKVMLGCINKTDKLDADGMNRLQRVGTLPTVWIAPGQLRDLRELPRTRMFLTTQRTRLKNRIQSNLNKYGLAVTGYSDPMGKAALAETHRRLAQLPEQSALATAELLEQLESTTKLIKAQEQRITQLVAATPEMQLLQTMPGVGKILSVVIALEVGEISRFPSAAHFASYSGTTPRVSARGDKVRFGRLRPDVNRYLKWAFIEAANCVRLHRAKYGERHVGRRYWGIAQRKGHQKAVGAVARHLAEATFHILSRNEAYKDPGHKPQGLQPDGTTSAKHA
jgi:transposase